MASPDLQLLVSDAQRTFIVGLGQLQVALPAPDLRALAALTTGACPTTTLRTHSNGSYSAIRAGGSVGRHGLQCYSAFRGPSQFQMMHSVLLQVCVSAFVYGTLSGGAASAAAAV